MKTPTQCPNCGSRATRSRQVVYESGTSRHSGRSSSRGLSFGLSGRRNTRLGFWSGSYSGTRQSIIAQNAGPLPIITGLGLLILGLILVGGGSGHAAILLVYLMDGICILLQ